MGVYLAIQNKDLDGEIGGDHFNHVRLMKIELEEQEKGTRPVERRTSTQVF